MLVLSRKEGEQIVMPGQDVTVTIVAIRGNRVRIGVTAPGNVSIYREEIYRGLDSGSGYEAETGLLQHS